MQRDQLRRLLEEVRDHRRDVVDALDALENLPFVEMESACVDTHRALRQGFPEVIFCQGKTPADVAAIAATLAREHGVVLATRAAPEVFDAVRQVLPAAVYHQRARAITIGDPLPDRGRGRILVASAGTADLPVAEEAALTARMLGNQVDTMYDVGVAGLHRLLQRHQRLRTANVVVVVAGMEGALASVVGGLVRVPVIAVPTSVGYGASFQGLAALLAMLNSCAAGVTVVNIDNGFGAGFAAALVNRCPIAPSNEEATT